MPTVITLELGYGIYKAVERVFKEELKINKFI